MAKNINEEYRKTESLGDRLADQITAFGGSWTFILCFLLVIGIYMLVNSGIGGINPFDCYPYVFLNLILAVVAAIQAPIIMMSQNRELRRDRLRAEQEYRINVRAEQEISDVQDHLHRMEDQLNWLVQEFQRWQTNNRQDEDEKRI